MCYEEFSFVIKELRKDVFFFVRYRGIYVLKNTKFACSCPMLVLFLLKWYFIKFQTN